MATMDLSLPEELKTFVEAEAAGSGYASPSEYVREVLLTLWRQKAKAALESELVRRIDGPPAIELTPQFWDDLKTRLRRRQGAAPL